MITREECVSPPDRSDPRLLETRPGPGLISGAARSSGFGGLALAGGRGGFRGPGASSNGTAPRDSLAPLTNRQ
jgi:hypothetical protein